MFKNKNRIFIFIGILMLIFVGYYIVLSNYFSQYKDKISGYNLQCQKANIVGLNCVALNIHNNYLIPVILNNISELNSKIENIDKNINSKIESLRLADNSTLSNINDLNNQLVNLHLNTVTIDPSINGEDVNINENSSNKSINLLINHSNYLTSKTVDIHSEFQQYITLRKQEGKLINPLWGTTESDLNKTINNMSNEEKAGQLLMFQAEGQELTSNYASELNSINAGSVILMGSNITSPSQISNFTTDITDQNTKIPILIATDQEGGVVKRVSWDNTAGETDWSGLSDSEVCALSKTRAQILFQNGINLNLAPVVDLTFNGQASINDRTISSDPKVVVDKAQTFVNCSQSANVFTTLKHFPGDGATSENSDKVLPVINKSQNDWLLSDAIPFEDIKGEDAVMAGNLLYQSIDPTNPASLSNVLINNILRKQFGYNGVVITDDLGALMSTDNISVNDELLRSINAGVDIDLYVIDSQTPDVTPVGVYNNLVSLIKNGSIQIGNVNTSLLRILKLKRYINYY